MSGPDDPTRQDEEVIEDAGNSLGSELDELATGDEGVKQVEVVPFEKPGLPSDTLKIQQLAMSAICDGCVPLVYLDPRVSKVFLPETVNMIWYDADQVQNQRLAEKQERISNISEAFVRFIQEFTKDWDELSNEQFDEVKKEGEQLFRLRKQKPGDKLLIGEIAKFCKRLNKLGVKINFNNGINIEDNENYKALRREVWINGTPAYILLENKRHETMNNADLLYWFKPTLAAKKAELKRQGKYKQVDDSGLQIAAEEQVLEGLNEQFKETSEEEDEFGLHGQDVLTAVIEEIFDGMPEIYQHSLKTNSITELQYIWRNQDGLTVESWRKI